MEYDHYGIQYDQEYDHYGSQSVQKGVLATVLGPVHFFGSKLFSQGIHRRHRPANGQAGAIAPPPLFYNNRFEHFWKVY